ncbi:alpha-L-rhamnosidase [Glaciihabitans sp. dw_435]|uniref:alpha-L-rhamnosidase n=1 Tax=Glaciihabitans sp. dw_435 TaxID=2720081 RepID=UPI001BD2BB31|nr:alpha-L-rhamnosidase [Glaciihabitans sp. dw_435]
MTSVSPAPDITELKAEYRLDTPVVATPTPRLSWKVASTTADWHQVSAEIRLGGGEASASESGATHTVTGADSVLVDWPFAPLESGEVVEVAVRVTGTDGVTSAWSEPREIVAGFLAPGQWTAGMIGLSAPERIGQPALLRTTFDVTGDVAGATLYATAHGVYQALINGTEVDDEVLKPGWTAYQYRLTHESTDVTDLLVPGRNALGITLAGGWFTESFGFREGAKPFYGQDAAAAAQLVISYTDGSTQVVTTDDTWTATGSGPVVASGIYAGETYDARKDLPGWASPDFDDSAWGAARVDGGGFPIPTPRSAPAVRRIEEVAVKEVITTPAGKTVVDFGQNLVGRLRITVRGNAGDTVILRHAEVLEHGELGVRPLRNAKATDHYTLAGGGSETYEPSFTFHGFRYAEIEGWPGEFDAADVTAVVIHSDMQRTGWFDSSAPLINRLHENVRWGMKGNFVYLPTDCPQRDERLGWTGDIQVFAPTASFLYDADGFLAGWLEDLALEQKAKGGIVPFIVPDVLGGFSAPAAAWGDAATVVPWVLYERFGDIGVLRTQFESMKSWADTLLGLAGDRKLWEGMFQFGDWLDPDAPADFPADAKTDPDIVASAYLFRSVDLVARSAAILGNTDDAVKYSEIAATVREAFLREYVTGAGRMLSDAQTGYALAIMFDIARDDAERQVMGDRLAVLVRSAGYRIGTGFVGTPLITDALTLTGHLDAAGRLLTQTENPSWLYPVTMGATTIWERWDSMLEDGSINPGEMTSFNHYALGAVADWLHRSLAGLAPAAPGYREITIHPHPLAGFDFANASHETPYGLASAGWSRSGTGTVTVDAVIPTNTTAEVWLPGASEAITVGSGTYSWDVEVPDDAAPVSDVSAETSLAAIMDDPEAYRAVIAAIAETDAAASTSYSRHTKWESGRSLQDSLFELPPSTQERIREVLGELTAARR